MSRVVPHTVVLWAVLCASASAAQVRVTPSCVAPNEDARLTATGLTPLALYSATIGERALGGGAVDDTGAVSATFAAPVSEGRFTVRVSDVLGRRGRTTLTVRRPDVDLDPAPKRPTARVRFVVRALGADVGSVWLHRVDPAGRHVDDVRLGTARGACGDLRSARLPLLPRSPRPGRWRLQIDGRMSYDAQATPRVVQTIRVTR